MKNNKGFTLIEILVSIALLTIMSISFLMLIANHFTILNRTKAITEEVFLAQRELEEEIDRVKQEILDINNGDTPADPRPLVEQTIFSDALGGVEVSYYETEIFLEDRHYYTLVSNIKPEPLDIISLESIDSNMVHNNSNVEYGYANSLFGITGEFSNANEFKYDHLLNQVEWYVANEKFIMPMPKSDDFDMEDNLEYNSYYFPTFPKDYELIDNETVYNFGDNSTDFDLFTDYGGRHIMYTVTPAAKSGKLGEQMASEPIFISGLPVTDDLVMHFDATYIDSSITNEVQTVGENWFVWKWYDISSIVNHLIPTEYAQNTGSKPLLNRTGTEESFIGQYVSFDENEELEILQNTSGELVVISVVRNKSEVEESKYFSHGGTTLKLEASTEESLNIWRVTRENVSTQSNSFEIGGNYIEIAEIIVYQGALSESELTELENYLTKKYQDVIFVVDEG